VRFLPPQLIREAMVVAGGSVLVSGASVHFSDAPLMTAQWTGSRILARPSLTIPKEVRVGVLFCRRVS